MAIATQQIHSGKLAEARRDIFSNQVFSIIAETSEWFESLYGPTSEDANHLSVSIHVAKIGGSPLGTEVLHAVLYQSQDLHTWSPNKTFSFAIDSVDNAEEDYVLPSTTEKYLKIQFSIDETNDPGPIELPYPNYTLEFHGTCWVTLANI